MLISPKPCEMERFRRNFQPTGYLRNVLFAIFKKLLFLPSAVRRPTWFPDILGNSSYPIFTKFGMQVYWVNSLYGIAFGDNSSIANRVIATLLLLSSSLVSRHFKECY